MSVCVCRMPRGPLSITGQAEDGCDSQVEAGVWVSAALRVWVGYLVQHRHLEEPGWSPRSSVWRRSCPGRMAAAGARSAPRGSVLQHGAARSQPGHRESLPSHPASRIWVAFGNTLARGY